MGTCPEVVFMTMAGIFLQKYTAMQYMEFCLRLLIAFLIGGGIGAERSKHFKEAGIRTHIIVCCTASLIMLISKYGFADLSRTGDLEYFGTKGADAARIAAQAISGISFLCAGVIIKVGGNIKGLTTAAGIWMTASIGLAIGAGMYILTGFMVVLFFLLNFIFKHLPLYSESYDGYHLTFVVKNGDDFDEILKKQLTDWNTRTKERSITWKRNDVTEYDYLVVRAEELRYGEVKAFVAENPCIISFQYTPMLKNIS